MAIVYTYLLNNEIHSKFTILISVISVSILKLVKVLFCSYTIISRCIKRIIKINIEKFDIVDYNRV